VDQPDQHLFGIIHSAKEIPPPERGEAGLSLMPLRMKAEHPSTALPHTARIHYGRAYEIGHNVPVRPIGLIHAGSMETLQSQFQSNVSKDGIQTGEKETPGSKLDRFLEILQDEDSEDDAAVLPADMEMVKSTQQRIEDNTSPAISPTAHPPVEYRRRLDPSWRKISLLEGCPTARKISN